MSLNHIPASFSNDGSSVAVGPSGQLAHRDVIEHSTRLERRLWRVRTGVWCLVGNGLSNQTFVEGPDGLIAIDSGESIQEMSAALEAVRAHTDAPLVGVIYTHFHYVTGTHAVLDAGAASDIPIWGHTGIAGNLQRYGTELSAAAGRGLVHQFGISLPLRMCVCPRALWST